MIRRFATAILLALAMEGPARAQDGLDLRNVDLEGFVRIIAEATGRTFVLDPSVSGRVNVAAPANVDAAALYEIFLNVLEVNRLTILEGVGADRIVPIAAANGLSTQSTGRDVGGYETRVIRLFSADAIEVASVIRPLLPAEAVLSVVEGSQLLIISDRAQNFARIEGVIASLDRQNGNNVETIRLSNGNAAEVAQTILGLEIAPTGATVSADTRSNAVLVSGPASFRERVRRLVGELDTPQRTVSTRVVRLSYADATQLAEVISQSVGNVIGTEEGGPAVVSEVSIVADARANALIVTAPADRIGSILQSIQQLDFRPNQVLIEGLIFELSVQTFTELSAQFGAVLNDAVAGGAQFAVEGRQTLSGVLGAIDSSATPSLGNGGVLGAGGRFGADGIAAFITALRQSNTTRVLSTPSIMTLNNEEAEIVVAQNVPFVTGSFATVGDSAIPDQPFQTIERQDVGLTLTVTPQITVDGTVRLAIQQEVSNLTSASSDAGGEITAKRSIRTNVIVRDGRVILLGGLLEDGNGSVGQRVPGASRLPVIGNLFRGRSAREDQRVLLVMLRPRVVKNDSEAESLTRELARDARRASRAIQPINDGRFPAVPDGGLPFDGADLDQPFDAGFIDSIARERMFPPLPSRLRFRDGRIEP